MWRAHFKIYPRTICTRKEIVAIAILPFHNVLTAKKKKKKKIHKKGVGGDLI